MPPPLRAIATFLTSHVTKKLTPGHPGTLRWQDKFGDDLVCVRYRLNEDGDRRYTTVEILVDERAIKRKPAKAQLDRMVFLRVAAKEKDLQVQVRNAGGKWNHNELLWELLSSKAKALKLADRIVKNV